MLLRFSRITLISSFTWLSICYFCFPVGALGITAQPASLTSSRSTELNSITQQRYHYELAKGALNKQDWQSFDQHFALLGNYALVPYLEYGRLKHNLPLLEIGKLDKFLSTYHGTFLETRLREQFLYTLAMKRRWSEYLRYYEGTSLPSKALQCYWLYARSDQGDEDVYDEIAALWQEGQSHPEACDPIFDRWRQTGGLTQEVAWARFHNAMQAQNQSLARYVRSFMDKGALQHADLYLQVHRLPYSIRKTRTFTEQSLHMQQIIAHGIRRYARKNAKDAFKYWELYEAQQLFPASLSTKTKLYIATRLIRNGDTALAERIIAGSHNLQEDKVIASIIRESLKLEDWPRVLEWINALSSPEQQTDRWRYWRARAITALDSANETSQSPGDIYLSLAEKRSFYGFLAADHIGSTYSLQQLPVEITASSLLTMESIPGLRRAKELWLKGDLAEAQAEWIFTTRDMASDDLIAAGELARQWGWYNKGIHAMITGNLWDYLSIRFPLAYETEIHDAASTTKVAPDLIYAVARQESAFSEKARSSAGAMGLMQLMPYTAKSTAKRNGIKHSKQDLYNPEHNIRLGGHYLQQLLKRYEGNRILAAAAYNAGPRRVSTWIEKNPQDLPYDIWIEIIPYKETRGYVQNVLAFSVIYGYRLGQPRNLVSDLEAKNRI
ncbi:transglycosylase SLT domain-containing protein [Teredinibacter purpureus]|uniref:transglycosylase SLT domain-containing protein n=1 Tax=Teredinibacter purpureus TaxID=2731756 RepID=UPI000697968A|nr:transglycosylase SLT domain-containing protein [Teredinibacter purpureus]